MNMMRFGATRGDQLVADEKRERQVRETIAMEMAEFPPSNSKLRAAEPMPSGRHAGPRRNFANDGGMDGFSHDTCSLSGACTEDTVR